MSKNLRVSGMKLKNYRKFRLRMNQAEFAKLLGVTKGYVSHLETGRVGSTMKTIQWLADKLGLDYRDISERKVNWNSDK